MFARKKTLALGITTLCIAGAPALVASADQDGANGQGMDESAMMEAWIKLGTPSDHHKVLHQFAGSWSLESTYWMAPGAPAETASYQSEAEVILGGRYLVERVWGEMEMPGMPPVEFEGHALMGYDNAKGHYFSHWVDNFSTFALVEHGNMNDEGQIVTEGMMFNPMFGKDIKNKSIVTIMGDDKRKLEMWMDFPGHGMFKHMEIVYTRN